MSSLTKKCRFWILFNAAKVQHLNLFSFSVYSVCLCFKIFKTDAFLSIFYTFYFLFKFVLLAINTLTVSKYWKKLIIIGIAINSETEMFAFISFFFFSLFLMLILWVTWKFSHFIIVLFVLIFSDPSTEKLQC